MDIKLHMGLDKREIYYENLKFMNAIDSLSEKNLTVFYQRIAHYGLLFSFIYLFFIPIHF